MKSLDPSVTFLKPKAITLDKWLSTFPGGSKFNHLVHSDPVSTTYGLEHVESHQVFIYLEVFQKDSA